MTIKSNETIIKEVLRCQTDTLEELMSKARKDERICWEKSDKELKNFLKSRESDIALKMENFGDLKQTFKIMFGREPKE